MDFVAVPFSYDYQRKPDYATMNVQGVLRAEAAGLVLEFRERVTMMSTGKTVDPSIRRLFIPWSEVQSAAVREPWLRRPRLVGRTRSLLALQGLPDVAGIEARLPVARADRMLAHEAAANIEHAIADHRLRQLQDPDPPSALPPV
jgi:hypothetical protein